MVDRRDFLVAGGLGLAGSITSHLFGQAASSPSEFVANPNIDIDLGKVVGPLLHSWENTAGSDRTVVGLREQWQQDLIRVRHDVGIRSVRCHGLFNDEMGIAAAGVGALNFLYVDQIYDKMMEIGVRPFVELSFMPAALASSNNTIFFYRGNTSPPKRWKDWFDLVQAFTAHCVQRYGIGEVGQWKFEVWNEPNITFWAGTQDEYFELYRQSVMAVKSVDKRLLVGGPSTAQVAWIPDMIRYCSTKGLPLDFVSTHIYPNDPQSYIFGREHAYSFEQVIPAAIQQVRHQVDSSVMPDLPVLITEWSSQNPAFIAETIKSCVGLADTLAYWTFSNVFEELGVPNGIFNSTFGMLDQWGIARPSFHTFALLHKLGDKRLQSGDGPVLATKRGDGSVAVLMWNLIPTRRGVSGFPGPTDAEASETAEAPLSLNLNLHGLGGRKSVRISHVNRHIGSALPAWKTMGNPRYPTQDQISLLRAAAELPPPAVRSVRPGNPGVLSIELPPNGVALLEFER